MFSLSIDEDRPYQMRNYTMIQPGLVGSVGDVNVQPRFKQSAPDMPMRFDPYFSHKNTMSLGSGVQNGTSASYMSGGMYAVTDTKPGRRRKIRNGWLVTDLRAPDTAHQPVLGEMPQYSWNNRIATIYDAHRTGDKFLPTGGYMPHPGEVPRGGQVPAIVEREDNDLNRQILRDPSFWAPVQKNVTKDVNQSIVRRFGDSHPTIKW